MSLPASLPPWFAAISEFPGFWESIQFQLTGLAVVTIALGSIWGLMEIMGFGFRLAARAKANRPPAVPATAAGSGPPLAVTPQVLAVIAATVHVMAQGRRHRIAAITPQRPAHEMTQAVPPANLGSINAR